MEEITLHEKTRMLCHSFYKAFTQDPDLFTDMHQFVPYQYDAEKVDAYYAYRQQQTNRKGFYILLSGNVIGEIGFKHIDSEKKECELEICMQNDSVKNKGYGTQAELLALKYAFEEMGMETVFADTVLKNTRSRHVLEKVGFRFIVQDEMFRYYKMTKGEYDER